MLAGAAKERAILWDLGLQATLAICLWILLDLAAARGSRLRRIALGSMVLSCAAWVLGEIMLRAAEGPAQVVFSRRVLFAGVNALPILMLWVACVVAGPPWFRRRPWVLAIAAVPLVAIYSALYWDRSGLYLHWTAMPIQRGPLFFVQIGLAWSAVVVATALLVSAARRLSGRHPLRAVAIAVGAALPLLGNAVYLISGAGGDDPTPALIGLGALTLRFAVIDSGLAAVLPLTARNLLEQLETGVVVANLDGVVVDANRAARRLLRRHGLRGERLELLLDRARRDDDRVIEIQQAPLRGPVGLTGTAVLLSDRTDAAQIEQQLLEQQRVESLGVLAGGIAHDFNNLLTGVITNAGVAQQQVPEAHPARARLGDVIYAARVASHLTDQLLAYAGKARTQTRPVDLSAEVREMESLLQSTAGKQCHLELAVAEDAPAVEADPAQIKQVIMNLVLNAAEATPPGGSVSVSTRGERLEAAALRQLARPGSLRPGRCVVLEVADTGAGMDAATRSRIFDPFFTSRESGRGLGLAATLGIVNAHHGALDVVSEPGEGSVFRVYLPACPKDLVPTRTAVADPVRPATPAVVPIAADASAPSPANRRGTVLVVDDEEFVLDAAYYSLEHYGYEPLLARDGPEAVDLLRERGGDVDLVLLDVTMPGMSGDETLQALRSIRPDVAIVLSSGYDEEETSRQLGVDGLAGFLRKPYDPDQLAAKIEEVLASRR